MITIQLLNKSSLCKIMLHYSLDNGCLLETYDWVVVVIPFSYFQFNKKTMKQFGECKNQLLKTNPCMACVSSVVYRHLQSLDTRNVNNKRSGCPTIIETGWPNVSASETIVIKKRHTM